jgi:hypothetical protein
MKKYISYNKITGEIFNNVTTGSAENLSPLGSEFDYLEVENPIDNGKYYLDLASMQPVAFPDRPDLKHTWNWSTKTWQDTRTEEQKYNQAAKAVKDKRTELLTDSDWVVIKALDQGTPIPQDWQTYRQALRDITLQPEFPYNVVWPVKP